MSDTILSGDFTVYYVTENRQKRIEWSGAATATRTVKELYLALMDLSDGITQMREGEPISAATPTDYTLGQIDNNDPDPWFIDKTTVEHLTGALLRTAGWARVEGTDPGIIRVPITGGDLVDSDIGSDITDSDTAVGTLLDFTTIEAWIRPDTSDTDDSFSLNPTGTLDCNSNSTTQNGAPESGASLWSNPFSIGSLAANTHIYIYQNALLLSEYKDTDIEAWWARDHFDVLVSVQEVGVLVDEGFVTVLARQYSKGDDYFITDLSAGIRTPIPFSTAVDLDNLTGYLTIPTGAFSGGPFTVGEEITDSDGAAGIVRAQVADTSLDYYLLDNLADFQSANEITGSSSNAQATPSGASSSAGPAALAGLSITHAKAQYDITEDGINEFYSIVIDVSDEALTAAWEWIKYITRRGNLATGNTDGIAAESYLGNDYRILYSTINVSGLVEGETVTQLVTGATGTVVADHDTDSDNYILILRNSRGTFSDTDDIESDGDSDNSVSAPFTVTPLVPVKQSPLGSFAGGTFFGADGVVLINVAGADENSYQLTDDLGNVVTAPTKITLKIENTRLLDELLFARTSAGLLDDSEYSIETAGLASGTIKVDPNIVTDTPPNGRVVVRDDAAGLEHYYRYTSKDATDTFTLFDSAAQVAEGGTDSDTIVDASFDFTTCEVGDIILNSAIGAVTYIESIIDLDNITVFPPVEGQASGNAYRVGATVQAYDTDDQVWVPFILKQEDVGTDGAPGDEEAVVTYVAPIPYIVRARNSTSGSYKIKPFVTTGSASASAAVSVIRNPETIT